MKLSILSLALSFALSVGALPAKDGSVASGSGERARCGVVAFNADRTVWMVASKENGWILPKGGFDSRTDKSWEDCVMREAEEEAGIVLVRSSITWLGVDDDVYWYKANVASVGTPTDSSLGDREAPRAFTISQARTELSKGKKSKKAGMRKALEAAI
ncbi:hypothetical protein Cob_v003182 [Colletotrichum orbiculare MAFF 240422]|uniref:Uncharacterized protein n=1 Tax=Colletotrichum orbiculare (strain 104-T / ATCC 96160 / CBS 514.97 / LARS 414 / MAFF 240422) TaxID=1213857 RepID=N4VA50_COLOR|nr:hypothetical protein Cob_v003182 [Colletotrichum orbiculare MAFF 240422]